MFWHEADGVVLPGAGRDFRFGAEPRRRVLDLDLRRRRRWLHNLVFDSGFLDLYVTVELLQNHLPGILVDDEHTFFLSIVPLVSFEHRTGHPRTIQVWYCDGDLFVGADLQCGRFADVHAGRLEVVLERVEDGSRGRIRERRTQLQLANLRIKVQPIVHPSHGGCYAFRSFRLAEYNPNH